MRCGVPFRGGAVSVVAAVGLVVAVVGVVVWSGLESDRCLDFAYLAGAGFQELYDLGWGIDFPSVFGHEYFGFFFC